MKVITKIAVAVAMKCLGKNVPECLQKSQPLKFLQFIMHESLDQNLTILYQWLSFQYPLITYLLHNLQLSFIWLGHAFDTILLGILSYRP